MKPQCLLGRKSLQPIANRRKNGATDKQDWDGRTHHKKCCKRTYSMYIMLKITEPHLSEDELENKALKLARL